LLQFPKHIVHGKGCVYGATKLVRRHGAFPSPSYSPTHAGEAALTCLVKAQKTRELPLHLSRLPKLEGAHFDARLKKLWARDHPAAAAAAGMTK
jgi:hypothetical protein